MDPLNDSAAEVPLDPDGFYVCCRVCGRTSRKRGAWSLGCPQQDCRGTATDIWPVSFDEVEMGVSVAYRSSHPRPQGDGPSSWAPLGAVLTIAVLAAIIVLALAAAIS